MAITTDSVLSESAWNPGRLCPVAAPPFVTGRGVTNVAAPETGGAPAQLTSTNIVYEKLIDVTTLPVTTKETGKPCDVVPAQFL